MAVKLNKQCAFHIGNPNTCKNMRKIDPTQSEKVFYILMMLLATQIVSFYRSEKVKDDQVCGKKGKISIFIIIYDN